MSLSLLPFPGPFDFDIGDVIASHMEFSSLMAYSGTCRDALEQAQKHVGRRIVSMLGTYFPQNPGLLHSIIREHGVVVVGTAVIHMLCSATTWTPRDLNFVAPQGHAQPLAEFLLSHGALDDGPQQMEWNFAVFGSNFRQFQMPDVGERYGKKITILESRTASVWPAVLFSFSSAQMDVIAPNHIVSPHPYLAINGRALCRGPDFREWYETRGLTVIGSSDPHGPDGRWCPNRRRSLRGGQGVAAFTWNNEGNYSDDETSQLVRSGFECDDCAELAWCVGDACLNVQCPYYSL